jgi:hypothetical protein
VTIEGYNEVIEGSGYTIQLMKAASLAGTAKAGSLTTENSVYTKGGASDLWGTTWTLAEIQNSAFGASVRVGSITGEGTQTIYLDYLKIAIDYTAPASSVRKQIIR